MKVQIEIDVGWLEDDGTVCTHAVREIVDQLLREPYRSDQLRSQVVQAFNKQVTRRIDKLVDAEFRRFATKEFTITDKWGDPHRRTTLRKELRRRFTEFVGYDSPAEYHKPTTKEITKVLDAESKKLIDAFQKQVSAELRTGLKDMLDTNTRSNIVEALLSDSKLKELFK